MTYTEEELQHLSDQFERQDPHKTNVDLALEVLRWTRDAFEPSEVTLATGFGAEGVVLIDMLASLKVSIPIFYLDTEVLFPETYQLRDQLEERYGIRFHKYRPALSLSSQAALYGENLWARNPDLCCAIRKVEPLKEALKDRAAWITAIRREQSPLRKNARIVEQDRVHGLIKINPLVTWTKPEVWRYIAEHHVPYNPLYDRGYASIGCIHCTTPVGPGEDERAGRWRGFQKTECGLHVANSQLQKERAE